MRYEKDYCDGSNAPSERDRALGAERSSAADELTPQEAAELALARGKFSDPMPCDGSGGWGPRVKGVLGWIACPGCPNCDTATRATGDSEAPSDVQAGEAEPIENKTSLPNPNGVDNGTD